MLLAVACASCASYQGTARDVSPAALNADAGWQRIESVPAVYQKGTRDCGPAALSAVLGYWRAPDPTLERAAIERSLNSRANQGSSAGALRDYARQRGFRAYVFHGELSDLQHELELGRPVIVGVHKALSSREWLAHYEVIIGYHAERQLLLSFDPAHGLRENSIRGFLEEWQRAGRTTLVVLPE